MSTTQLEGRHVAVLGGTSGIGLATAQHALAAGARVTVGGRSPERLEATGAELGSGASTVQVDATDHESLRRFYRDAGPITDLVLTVTRRGGVGAIADLAAGDLLGAFAGKTVPHLQAIGLALDSLSEHGTITLVTAGSAQSSLPQTAGLAAVNGGLEAAVPPLAVELAPRRVNAVSPGVIETDWWAELPEADRRQVFADFAGKSLVGRNGRPDDVADAILALIQNEFIDGAVIPVDGGLRLS